MEMPLNASQCMSEYLREQLKLPAGAIISLWSLPDPPAGEQPGTPLPMLIKLAIHGSPMKMLTLQGNWP